MGVGRESVITDDGIDISEEGDTYDEPISITYTIKNISNAPRTISAGAELASSSEFA